MLLSKELASILSILPLSLTTPLQGDDHAVSRFSTTAQGLALAEVESSFFDTSNLPSAALVKRSSSDNAKPSLAQPPDITTANEALSKIPGVKRSPTLSKDKTL